MEPTFSYIYSVPYIILFFVYFLLFLKENNLRKKGKDIKYIRYTCVIIFLFFFGFRGYIDTDFAIYYPLYQEAPTIFNSSGITKYFSDINDDFLTRIEPGFKIFIILIKTLSSDYFLLQFISTLIDVLFLNYFFKKYSPRYALSFILLLVFSGLIIEINLLRNSKSIFLFLYSLQFIKDRKIVKFALCNALGLLLHSSAIFYFPVYFFLHKKISKPIIWIVFLIGNLIYLTQLKFITPFLTAFSSIIGGSYASMAEIYSKTDLYNSGYGITFGFLERLITFVLFYTSYNKLDDYLQDKKILNIFYNSFFLYSVSYLFLSEYSIFIDRITTLFVFSYWILYAQLYEVLNHRLKTIFATVMLFFGTYKMYKSNNFIIRNYQNILFDNPSISRAYSTLGKHLDKILNPPKN